MKESKKISETVIRRLPVYYRYLEEESERGQVRISSKGLSEKTGFTASQIRQDLNNFGGFGQQGYGYNVESLKSEIAKIIGINKSRKAVVIGSGSLGGAISKYKGFRNSGLEVKSLFDSNPKKIGTTVEGVEVRGMDELETYIKQNRIDVGIITTPAESAQAITDKLISLGIKGIWNFAPLDLEVPEGVILESVRLNDSLLTLFYYLNHK